MPKARPLYRGNHAITILRLFLWLLPALFLPLVALLGAVLGKYLPTPANPKRELVVSTIVFVSLQIVIAPVICIGAVLAIGTFWH